MSNRILPEAALGDIELYCCDVCAKYSDMSLLLFSTILAVWKSFPNILLGPSNRHGPYMPQAEEAVANERVLFFVRDSAAAETSDDDRRRVKVASRRLRYQPYLVIRSA